MKKTGLYHLLVIFATILLAGLIASCGDSPEPQFKIIESKEYNDSNRQTVGDALWDKYFEAKESLNNPETIYAPYKKDVDSLITNEMDNKKPDIGLFMIIKMDQYKLFVRCYWNNKPYWEANIWIFDNN